MSEAPSRSRTQRTGLVAFLLLGSGLCALVYQTVWLRDLRLVFGASTMASAAVLAIFLGGLGFGGLFFGPRADRAARPLALYARLELGIALTAALTPFLIALAARLYVFSGGSPALGTGVASILRLALSTLVLGTTTFLMGGTLPAASRAVASDEDLGRRSVAALYGANTLGGMAGVLLPTFFLFERIGIHKTLWAASLVNVLLALVALRLSTPAPARGTAPQSRAFEGPPAAFVLFAAAAVGFAFLVMELVWYRMLAPILGGSTFTFGLILALVLFGIGAGGILYAALGLRRPAALRIFAITCTAEALLLALPFALGDRVAAWALLLQPGADSGFGAVALSWTLVASLVVLPGSVVAGYQFPLLIALLGRGRAEVGRHVGLGYAWNTIGAIAGSLAAGFGLIELLTAPGAWRATIWLLTALAAAAFWLSARPRWTLGPAAASLALAAALTTATGPTAAWRHAPIGAGRLELPDLSANGVRKWMQETRRSTLWEAEGKESSVALQSVLGLSFVINGKSDGSARYDAPTQVMVGLVGAILHPHPESALVVGLGTGSTAGWLAAVPSIARVDVAELEPAILEVARACAPVNRNALENPKVTVFLGDGRELLLTSRPRYDLIASEPSNPFRAGIASLFTREFYHAVRARLNPEGLFLQWVQAYEVDAGTIRTILATLASVFDHVETWQTAVGDLLLVCSPSPLRHDPLALRSRIREEPFRSALALAWRVEDLEGFCSRFVAGPAYARSLNGERINTDDDPVVEFGFARTVGRSDLLVIESLRDDARARGADRPEGLTLDWSAVEDRRLTMHTLEETPPVSRRDGDRRAEAQIRYLRGDLPGALEAWGSREPADLVELAMAADLLASAGSARALPLIERLREAEPAEADVVSGILFASTGRSREAAEALVRAFTAHRTDPWPWPYLMGRALVAAKEVARRDPSTARGLYESLMEPFAVRQLEHDRLGAAMEIAKLLGPAEIIRAFEKLEPHFLWNRDILTVRAALYREAGHPLAKRAERELREFLNAASD